MAKPPRKLLLSCPQSRRSTAKPLRFLSRPHPSELRPAWRPLHRAEDLGVFHQLLTLPSFPPQPQRQISRHLGGRGPYKEHPPQTEGEGTLRTAHSQPALMGHPFPNTASGALPGAGLLLPGGPWRSGNV